MSKLYVENTSSIMEVGELNLARLENAGVRVAERRYSAGDLIFAPGDPDGQLYFLLDGTVRLYTLYGSYKQATVALLRDGGVFGELSLTETGRQRSFAKAVSEARVAVARKANLVEIVRRDPPFAMALLSSFSERVEQSDAALDSLLSRQVSVRLARLLLNLGERFGKITNSGTVLDVRLTHQDLSEMIFSTREAVSKAMSKFQRDGLIEVRNRRICITPLLTEDTVRSSSRVLDGAR
jgi:CRP/FNR family transcriptional regulator, global nitrogen regulator